MAQRSTLININTQGLYVERNKDYPSRPTLVFLHDSLGCAQLWRDFPKILAEATQCNILVYDRLGYGKSDPMPTPERPVNYMELEADILNGLLIQLEIDNAILFGHSDGGTIALHAASKYPKRIKAVICEAAHIFVEDVTLQGIYDAMETYKTTNLPERLEKYHGNKVDTLFKAWTETWTRSDYRDWNIEHCLPKIGCPLLFIQGEADEYGSLQQVEKTINQVSGISEKFIIPDVGHTPHKECPIVVLSRSVEFIEQLNKL
ncbi:alpha/beta hydrolase [Fulvivirga sp. 29W222]|uniref:Alpha/beta hydrolase n=1 Tax=Fulvivirga marina TaxID=2494733 RepID=A0A937G290_9BACT|nr:alpha/beta hydrolase [Fulvivirga marina]MBL6449347.1 alpha/beta hydrolase [Fulvivirga marina]